MKVRESTIIPSLEVFLQEVGIEAKSMDELTQGVFRGRSTMNVGASTSPISTEG